LTIIRNAEPQIIKVNREVTKAPPVEAKIVQGDIAYVKVPLLSAGRTSDAKKHIEELPRRARPESFSTSGLARWKDTEGYNLANLFVDSGSLGYFAGQKSREKLFQADPKMAITKVPLVVLIDGGTGGAAEIAAASAQGFKTGHPCGHADIR
jgi:carboxyl-terminal processing protease